MYYEITADIHPKAYNGVLATIDFKTNMIYLGTNTEEINHYLNLKMVDACFKKYNTCEELYENEIETLIIHEYIHGVITTEINKETSDRFDEIDINNEISGVM